MEEGRRRYQALKGLTEVPPPPEALHSQHELPLRSESQQIVEALQRGRDRLAQLHRCGENRHD